MNIIRPVKNKHLITKLWEKIIDICFYSAVVVSACTGLFYLTNFVACTMATIPTDSMVPTLIPGDRILIDKLTMGGRIFNFRKLSRNEQHYTTRIPSFSRLKRNDVIVFNWPYQHTWDVIEMDLYTYYVKRCVGLPGDTLEIRDGLYSIRGVEQPVGNQETQKRFQKQLAYGREKNESIFGVVWDGFPYHEEVDWSIKDFGPLYIPAKGDVIPINKQHIIFYYKLMKWEQGENISLQDDRVLLEGVPIDSYQFERNYYFVSGDKIEDSQDSRYWGFLPEDFIVGKAWRVLCSKDPHRETFRKDRFFKKIE